MSGFSIKYNDIERANSAIHTGCANLQSGIANLESQIRTVTGDSTFKGQFSASIKAYLSDVHMSILQVMKQISQEFESQIKSYRSSCLEIDGRSGFCLDEAGMEYYLDAIKRGYNSLLSCNYNVNQAISGVIDITGLRTISLDSLLNCTTATGSLLGNLEQRIRSNEKSKRSQLQSLERLLRSLEQCIQRVHTYPSNCVSSYKIGSFEKLDIAEAMMKESDRLKEEDAKRMLIEAGMTEEELGNLLGKGFGLRKTAKFLSTVMILNETILNAIRKSVAEQSGSTKIQYSEQMEYRLLKAKGIPSTIIDELYSFGYTFEEIDTIAELTQNGSDRVFFFSLATRQYDRAFSVAADSVSSNVYMQIIPDYFTKLMERAELTDDWSDFINISETVLNLDDQFQVKKYLSNFYNGVHYNLYADNCYLKNDAELTEEEIKNFVDKNIAYENLLSIWGSEYICYIRMLSEITPSNNRIKDVKNFRISEFSFEDYKNSGFDMTWEYDVESTYYTRSGKTGTKDIVTEQRSFFTNCNGSPSDASRETYFDAIEELKKDGEQLLHDAIQNGVADVASYLNPYLGAFLKCVSLLDNMDTVFDNPGQMLKFEGEKFAKKQTGELLEKTSEASELLEEFSDVFENSSKGRVTLTYISDVLSYLSDSYKINQEMEEEDFQRKQSWFFSNISFYDKKWGDMIILNDGIYHYPVILALRQWNRNGIESILSDDCKNNLDISYLQNDPEINQNPIAIKLVNGGFSIDNILNWEASDFESAVKLIEKKIDKYSKYKCSLETGFNCLLEEYENITVTENYAME